MEKREETMRINGDIWPVISPGHQVPMPKVLRDGVSHRMAFKECSVFSDFVRCATGCLSRQDTLQEKWHESTVIFDSSQMAKAFI